MVRGADSNNLYLLYGPEIHGQMLLHAVFWSNYPTLSSMSAANLGEDDEARSVTVDNEEGLVD